MAKGSPPPATPVVVAAACGGPDTVYWFSSPSGGLVLYEDKSGESLNLAGFEVYRRQKTGGKLQPPSLTTVGFSQSVLQFNCSAPVWNPIDQVLAFAYLVTYSDGTHSSGVSGPLASGGVVTIPANLNKNPNATVKLIQVLESGPDIAYTLSNFQLTAGTTTVLLSPNVSIVESGITGDDFCSKLSRQRMP
jgi:hypothetical protein